MKKRVFGRQLSRSRPAREALFATLTRALILNGKIVTTKAKAKSVQGMIEKVVTTAKKGELSGRRRILSDLDNARDALNYLYKNVIGSFSARSSGFTRIISLPPRKGDNAKMVRMEWTEKIEISEKGTANSSKTEKKVKTKVVNKTVKKATKR